MKSGRITTLVENTVYGKHLCAEHGFSAWIEADGKKIIFDTGQSHAFISNAASLGIDVREADICVISHGHYDHTGGLMDFMKANKKAEILIRRDAFLKKFNSRDEYIGIRHPDKLPMKRIHFTEGITRITESIFLMPPAKTYYPEDMHTSGFSVELNGITSEDQFTDEQNLVIESDGSLAVISGCSHRGICNIIRSASEEFNLPVKLVTGGFHLKNESRRDMQLFSVKYRKLSQGLTYVSHCTGLEAFSILKNILPDRVFYNSTGNEICF